MSAALATLARRALGSAPTLHPAACWAAPAAVQHMHVSSAAPAGSRSGAASGGGGSGGGAPPAGSDAFTAALQQKTEAELRELALKQGHPSTAAAAAAAAAAGDEPAEPAAGEAPLPPHGKSEIGGYQGPEPTRYSDWEIKGRCSDF